MRCASSSWRSSRASQPAMWISITMFVFMMMMVTVAASEDDLIHGPCMPSWVPFVEAASAPTLCYRVYGLVDQDEMRSSSEGQAYCRTQHAQANLASITSASISTFVVHRFIQDNQLTPEQMMQRRWVVLVGGVFMNYGSIGMWYGDSSIYNSTAYDATAPSSPSWPTATHPGYQNWAPDEPRTSFGCVGMGVAVDEMGMWVSEGCRVAQPFLCSYIAAGGGEDATTTTTTTSTTTTTTAPPAEVHCLRGWTPHPPTAACVKVFGDALLTPRVVEERCEEVLEWVAADPSVVHAASATTAEENELVARLLRMEMNESSSTNVHHDDDDGDLDAVALIGATYTHSGANGVYADGASTWRPDFVAASWAAGQPKTADGCVAINTAGSWVSFPCRGRPNRFYACAYHPAQLDLISTPPPNETTTEPINESSSGRSSTLSSDAMSSATTTSSSSSSSSEVPTMELGESILSMAGATHLVVAASTVGIYTIEVDARYEDSLDGALMYFAPTSPALLMDVGDVASMATSMYDFAGAVQCDGAKKQTNIFRVQGNRLMVAHPPLIHGSSMHAFGHVCVSRDGHHYEPTAITYEVVRAELRGFVALPTAKATDAGCSTTRRDGGEDDGDVEDGVRACTRWLPPQFITDAQVIEEELRTEVHVEWYSSGVLQLIMNDGVGTGAMSVGMEQLTSPASISDVRFSTSIDCNDDGLDVLRMTTTSAVMQNTSGASWLAYTHAGLLPVSGDGVATRTTELFVCVAVRKTLAGDSSMMVVEQMNKATPRQLLQSYNPTLAELLTRRVLGASSSLDAFSGAPTPVYSAVRTLRVYLHPPPLSIRGMWSISPRLATRSGGAGFVLQRPEASCAVPHDDDDEEEGSIVVPQRLLHLIDEDGQMDVRGVASSRHVEVGIYDSSIILIDGDGLRPGMMVRLARDAYCGEEVGPIASVHRAPYAPTMMDLRASISNITRGGVYDDDDERSIAFLQLQLNHTGMWSQWANTSLVAEEWVVCLSFTPFGGFFSLHPPLTISVLPWKMGHVEATTINTYTSATPTSSSSWMERMNAPRDREVMYEGFAGVLRLHGISMDGWSRQTIAEARIAFSVEDDDDDADACSNTSSFYGPPLPLLHKPVVAHTQAMNFHDAYANVLVPPNYLQRTTPASSSLRLCISVPLPFALPSTLLAPRLFRPTAMRVAVAPIAVMRVGDVATGTNASLISMAELTNNNNNNSNSSTVLLAVEGSGLRRGLLFFLSSLGCEMRTSVHNFTLTSSYDVPPHMWANMDHHHHQNDERYYIVVSPTFRSKHAADLLFGSNRVPLHLCLMATQDHAQATEMRLVVERPRVLSITNTARDTARMMALHLTNTSSSSSSSAVLMYAAYMNLVVEGFGVDARTELVPARSCTNTSTFAWPSPRTLSPTPLFVIDDDDDDDDGSISRFMDANQWASSWFLPLTPHETSAHMLSQQHQQQHKDDDHGEFVWCVRDASRGEAFFTSTGISVQLIIPPVVGLIHLRSASGVGGGGAPQPQLTLPLERGIWNAVRLVGPLMTWSSAPLYVRVLPLSTSCNAAPTLSPLLVATNGELVVPADAMPDAGLYHFCMSAIAPQNADDDVPTTSPPTTWTPPYFMELPRLRLRMILPSYAISAVNGSKVIDVRHGQSWLLAMRGRHISTATVVLPAISGRACSGLASDAAAHGIHVERLPQQQRDDDDGASTHALDEWHTPELLLPLTQSFIRSLSTGTYVLCFLPNPFALWHASDVLLRVDDHHRQPSSFNYFGEDEDVLRIRTNAPNKIVLPWNSREDESINIVGVDGRDITLFLRCSSNEHHDDDDDGGGDVLCPPHRRIMFARPLDTDGDPCFYDADAVQSAVVLGPYTIDVRSSITIAAAEVDEVEGPRPSMREPWIMCVEMEAERWREPRSPRVFLETTSRALPTGLRSSPDNASNSTAHFHEDGDVGVDEHATLVMRAGSGRQPFFLNGFGIRSGLVLRFAEACSLFSANTNVSASDKLLLDVFHPPITVTTDDGLALLPAVVLQHHTTTPLAMCISNDGGQTYQRTNLSLHVMPSWGSEHTTAAVSGDLVAHALAHTLVVLRNSHGYVDVGHLLDASSHRWSELRTGTLVWWSRSSLCRGSLKGAATWMSAVMAHNIIFIGQQFTAGFGHQRLFLCARAPFSSSSLSSSDVDGDDGWSGMDLENDPYSNDANSSSSSSNMDDADAYTGVELFVLNISVDRISMHPTKAAQIIFQRDDESVVVPTHFSGDGDDSSSSSSSSSCTGALYSSVAERLACRREKLMMRMSSSAEMAAFFGLLRAAVSNASTSPSQPPTSSSWADAASSSMPLQLTTATEAIFSPSGEVRMSSSSSSSSRVALALTPPDDVRKTFSPSQPAQVLISADGGRTYLSQDLMYATAGWSNTLAVHGSNNNDDDDHHHHHRMISRTSTVVSMAGARSTRARIVDQRFPCLSGDEVACISTDLLWGGFVSDVGFIASSVLHLHATTMANKTHVQNVTLQPWPLHVPQLTGLTMSAHESMWRCLMGGATRVLYLRRLDAGRLLNVPHSCDDGLVGGDGQLRLARVNDDDNDDDVCARLGTYATTTSTRVAVLSHLHTSDDDDDGDAHGFGLRLRASPSINTLVEGWHRLCVQDGNVFLSSAVAVLVEDAPRVYDVGGVGDGGRIALFYGTNARVEVRANVVAWMAVAPASPRFVELRDGTNFFYDGGCSGIPQTINTSTGSTLLHENEDALLRMPPSRVRDGGRWLLRAKYLRVEVPSSAYLICASVDGGLSYQHVGRASSSSSSPLSMVVLPPTLTSLVIHNHSHVVSQQHRSEEEAHLLRFDPSTTTRSAVHLQRIVATPASSHDDEDDDDELTIVAPLISVPDALGAPPSSALTITTDRIPSRVASYFVPPSVRCVGNGIGPRSGRDTSRVANIAGAVAILRSRIVGAQCDGWRIGNNTNNDASSSAHEEALATPIFLMNLHHGDVWSREDHEFWAPWMNASSSSDSINDDDDGVVVAVEDEDAMIWRSLNPVLHHSTWLRRALMMSDAHLSLADLLAAPALRGDSLLVCLSTDGTTFFSPNANRLVAALMEDSFSSSASSQPTNVLSPPSRSHLPTSAVMVAPLVVRAELNTLGSTRRGDVSMRVVLAIRPRTLTTSPSTIKSMALHQLQQHLAELVGIDANIIILTLHESGAASTNVQGNNNATRVAQVYSLTLSIAADAVVQMSGDVWSSEDILLRCADVLRGRGAEALLAALVPPRDAHANWLISPVAANYTLGTGEDVGSYLSSPHPHTDDDEWLQQLQMLPHNFMSQDVSFHVAWMHRGEDVRLSERGSSATAKFVIVFVPVMLVVVSAMMYRHITRRRERRE